MRLQRTRLRAQANALLGRTANASLIALLPANDAETEESLEKLEKEILPQGRELLTKLYQNYLFGGVPVSALLWQEQQLYQTELDYHVGLARDAMRARIPDAPRQ